MCPASSWTPRPPLEVEQTRGVQRAGSVVRVVGEPEPILVSDLRIRAKLNEIRRNPKKRSRCSRWSGSPSRGSHAPTCVDSALRRLEVVHGVRVVDEVLPRRSELVFNPQRVVESCAMSGERPRRRRQSSGR